MERTNWNCKNCGHPVNYAYTQGGHRHLYHFGIKLGDYYPEPTRECISCNCTNPELIPEYDVSPARIRQEIEDSKQE